MKWHPVTILIYYFFLFLVEEKSEKIQDTSKPEEPSLRSWSIGDRCLAVWVPDGQSVLV